MSIFILCTFLIMGFTHCNCGITYGSTMMDNLNMDCHLEILDKLSVRDLLTLAEINKYFSILASDVFHRIHSKRTMSIFLPYVKSEEMYEPESDEYFQISSVEVAVKMLKHFGHLVRSLKIQVYSGNSAETELIKKSINLYCSDTLIEMDISNYISGNFFYSTMKPFKMVQKLSLNGKFGRLDSFTLKSSEMFPMLRELTTALSVELDEINTIEHYSHLEEVIADFTVYENEDVCIDEYKRLITTNPQLKKLTLIHSTQDLLKFAAENLPNLESLELQYHNIASRDETMTIRFKNVKYFKVIGYSLSIPRNITFDKLVEFETGGFRKDCWKWIDFVREYRNLEKFRLNDCYLGNHDVIQLAEAELSADEMLIQFDGSINMGNMARLIESSKHLRKVHLVQLQKSNSTLEELHRNFSEWNIIDVGTSEIFLEKKYDM